MWTRRGRNLKGRPFQGIYYRFLQRRSFADSKNLSAEWKPIDSESSTSTSLIPETLQNMKEDVVFQKILRDLKKKGRVKMTLEENKRRRRSLQELHLPSFHEMIFSLDKERKVSAPLEVNNKDTLTTIHDSATSYSSSFSFPSSSSSPPSSISSSSNGPLYLTQSRHKNINSNNSICHRLPTRVFQMNIGLYCNQACSH